MKKFIIAGLLIFLAPIVLATVSSTTTQQSFTGAGSSSLSVTLSFHDNDHIQVWIQDTATTPATLTQLVYGAGAGKFTITGGDPGTTVVLGTALTATQTAIVKRVVPLTQTTDYVDNGPFRAETHEKALDRLTMQVQQVDSDVSKKIGLSPVSTASPVPTFPDPVANTFVQYDTGGSTLTLSPASPASGDVLKFDGSAWAKYGLDAAMALKADQSSLDAHTSDTGNPHSTTAEQVGAPTTGEFAAHVGNNLNPHIVTPSQVGADTAQWNANKIVDKTVDSSAIADGRVLTYSSGTDTLIYSPAPLSPSLMDGHIFVGNVTNQAVDVAMSGDATISNTGVVTVSNAATADAVTGIVDIANGGTGQSTAEAAFTALAPTAVAGQVAKWNGSEWIAAADDASGSSPVSFYFHNQASDIGGYETLLTYADGSTEVNEATVVSSATSPVLIDSYGSSTAIGGTQIDGGVWTFDFYARVDSAVGVTRLRAEVYARTAGGSEGSPLFTVQTNDINNTSATPMLYEVQTVQNAVPINATDRLVVKVYAVTDSVVARTLTWTYEGNTYWSHFHTPLIRRHNDLAGLNEGDYKHLTATEYSGLDDATSIKGKTVDDTAIANGKALVYNSGSGNLEYGTVASSGGGGEYNYVINPSAAEGISDWTETDADSDASFGQSTVTTFQGLNSFAYDAADNVDKVCADLNTVSGSFTAEAALWYKGDASLYELEIQDGSGNMLTEVDLTNESDWREAYLIYPATAGVKVCVVSTGDGAAINFTKVTFGKSVRASQVSQAGIYGSATWAATSGCEWTVGNGTSIANIGADTDCPTPTVTDNASAPATNIPAITFSSLPAGEYLILASGFFQKGASGTVLEFRMSDGTNVSNTEVYYVDGVAAGTPTLAFRMRYAAPQSNVTLNLQMGTAASTSGYISTVAYPFSLSVYRFPLASQTAVTVDTAGGSWSGVTGVSASCDYVITQTTYASDFGADADCTLTEKKNINFGTVTGDNKSITFTPKAAGKTYSIEATVSAYTGSADAIMTCQLTDGATAFAFSPSIRPSAGSRQQSITLKGQYGPSTAASTTFKLQCAASTGSAGVIGTALAPAISWSIVDISQSIPAPILQNQVSTSAAGGVRVEAARIVNNGSTCSMTQSGDGFASVGSRNTGTCTVVMNSAYWGGALPYCTCTNISGAANFCKIEASSSWPNLVYYTINDSGSPADATTNLICTGPR